MRLSTGKGPSTLARSVLGDYLRKVPERNFDLPFISLLWAMGYYDIHLTHGRAEFGKDVIAKIDTNGRTIQYSFQLKQGDINQTKFRNDILGQLLEMTEISLSHPNFNPELEHHPVLVLTGRLTGNAALSLQKVNDKRIEREHNPIEVWDYESLVDLLADFGVEQVHAVSAASLESYGNFQILLGKSLQNLVEAKEIEAHFRSWIRTDLSIPDLLIGSVTECELLAQQLGENGYLYERIHCYLNLFRVILFNVSKSPNEINFQELLTVSTKALDSIADAIFDFVVEFRKNWIENEKDMVRLTHGSSIMIGYLVTCSRVIECLGLAYLLNMSHRFNFDLIDLLDEFITTEQGAQHPPSDNYVIPIVIAVLSLNAANKSQTAFEVIRNATIWVCDRYDDGFGLAQFGSSYKREIEILFGYPFDFIDINKIQNSFLATALLDLSAFIEPINLYPSVVNDILAVNIFPQYWQLLDELAMFEIHHEKIVTYPNIVFEENPPNFSDFNYAEHIRHELTQYELLNWVPPVSLQILSVILRDRYFPCHWPEVVKEIYKYYSNQP